MKKQNLTQHNLSGYIPDTYDPRDILYTSIAKPYKSLPTKVDLRSGLAPTEDQGQLGSCTANALVGACEFLEKRYKSAFMDLSRLFVYYNERLIEGTVGTDSGAMIRDGCKTLNKDGVCPEMLLPYDIKKFTEQPSKACYDSALKHRVTSYHRLNVNLTEMKQCLAEGFPFVFGFTVFSNFNKIGSNGILTMPKCWDKSLGGHAVLAVGYNNTTSTFIIENSWSDRWGDKGYFYMPYKYITKYGNDFWTLRIMTEDI